MSREVTSVLSSFGQLGESQAPTPYNCGRIQPSPSFYIHPLMSLAPSTHFILVPQVMGLGSSTRKRRKDSLGENKIVSTVFS